MADMSDRVEHDPSTAWPQPAAPLTCPDGPATLRLMRVAGLAILFLLNGGGSAAARTTDGVADDSADAPPSAPGEQLSAPPLTVAPVEASSSSPQARLDAAVQNYQLGQWQRARQQLSDLVLDPNIDDPKLRQEARVYLGELLYTHDDEEGARRFFEQVLRQDPSYAIDHFRHPPDVCGFFDYVRAYTAPSPPPPPPTPPPQLTHAPPLPLSAWMPIGGVYHLSNGEPGRGALYLATELTLLAGSTGLYVSLAPAQARTYTQGDNDERRRLTTLKYTQLGLTGAYWAVWVASRMDAARHWRVHVVPTLKPTPDGTSLSASSVSVDTRF